MVVPKIKYMVNTFFIRNSIIILLSLFSINTLSAQKSLLTDIPNRYVSENKFLQKSPDNMIPRSFEECKAKLPQPEWEACPDAISAYWKAWEIAFSNLYTVEPGSGLISPYIDAAFNRHLFMWDSSFMVMFGRYGKNAFNFQQTLDNFYAKQHRDGFISREISQIDGSESFEKYDISSTGPNLLPWAEWEYYLMFGNKERLKDVFPALLAYYQWFRSNYSWPDGSYFSSGWGCGMDNQPRLQKGYSVDFSHGFMSWVDITIQQVFAGNILVEIAEIINRRDDVKDIIEENKFLRQYVRDKMWDEASAYYYDLYRDGTPNYVKSIAAYWSLLANIVPDDKLERFLEHLSNPMEFNRNHRPPTLSADHLGYEPDGGYWRGGVWAPTTYMLLKGLTNCKQDSLAYEIALNHYNNVIDVYNRTGTLWENYAPEKGFFPKQSRKDFVGWTGITPISILFEYIYGIHIQPEGNSVVWDVRLTDTFGVKNLPVGKGNFADFICHKRKRKTDKPDIRVKSDRDITLKLIWEGGSEIIYIKGTSL